MLGLKNIHKHVIAKNSIDKAKKIFESEFPYSFVSYDKKTDDGFYQIYLDKIYKNDVDKFIKILYDFYFERK